MSCMQGSPASMSDGDNRAVFSSTARPKMHGWEPRTPLQSSSNATTSVADYVQPFKGASILLVFTVQYECRLSNYEFQVLPFSINLSFISPFSSQKAALDKTFGVPAQPCSPTLFSPPVTHFACSSRGLSFLSFSKDLAHAYVCVCVCVWWGEVFSKSYVHIFNFGLKLLSVNPLKFTPHYPFDFAPNLVPLEYFLFWAPGTLINFSELSL